MTTQSKDESVLVTNCRLSYFYGFRPYKGDSGKDSYCAHLIIPETHPVLPALTAGIRKVAVAKFGADAEQILQTCKAQDKLPIHRGDISKAGKDGYKGMLFISANSSVRPRILATINGVNQEVDETSEFAPYSGCYANAIISLYAQDHPKGGKRVNAQLTGVQFVKHGPRLGGGGRVASLDEFGVVAADADAPAPKAAGDGLI